MNVFMWTSCGQGGHLIFLTIWNTNTHHTIYKLTCLIHVVFTKMTFHQFTSHPPPGQVIQVLQVSQASPGASLVHRTVSLRFRYVFALPFSHADDSPDGWTGHQFHSNQCDHGSTRETKPTINGHNISTTSQTSLIEIPVPAPPMPPNNHPFLDVFELQTVFFQIRWANITPAFKVIPIPRGRVVRCYGALDQTWPLLVWCTSVQRFGMQYPLTHSRHVKQQNYHKLLWLSYPRPSPNRQTPKKFQKHNAHHLHPYSNPHKIRSTGQVAHRNHRPSPGLSLQLPVWERVPLPLRSEHCGETPFQQWTPQRVPRVEERNKCSKERHDEDILQYDIVWHCVTSVCKDIPFHVIHRLVDIEHPSHARNSTQYDAICMYIQCNLISDISEKMNMTTNNYTNAHDIDLWYVILIDFDYSHTWAVRK